MRKKYIQSHAPRHEKSAQYPQGFTWRIQRDHTITRAEINGFLAQLPRKIRKALKGQLRKERQQLRLGKATNNPTTAMIQALKLIAEAEQNNEKARVKAQRQSPASEVVDHA